MVSMMIRDEIDYMQDLEAQQTSSQNNDLSDGTTGEGNNLVDTVQHITLGSALHPLSIAQLEQAHSSDLAFHDLRKKIARSLSSILTSETGELRRVSLLGDHQVCYDLYIHHH